ncbi:hypothetical protein NOC27_520 [Nitrosococcus oceani AFC27]|uniref:hypothetical protein n=1 Tax=Nitrosococcus oceani TaxID=1229 RepID=UPI000183C2AD|nr:hypothetical protein [Nitrosococcus oceani]EDZ67193.1 hypothetical protein NOC27_520 [Nitrosococcus oceani AFC27]
MVNFSRPAETAENDKVANPQGVVILPNKWKYAFSSYFPGVEPLPLLPWAATATAHGKPGQKRQRRKPA